MRVIGKCRVPLFVLSLFACAAFAVGRADAIAATQPATRLATQPATQPVTQYVPDGTDLAPLLATARPGASFYCHPGGHYRVSCTVIETAPGVFVEGNGAQLVLTASEDSSSNLEIRGECFSLQDFAVNANGVFVYVLAPDCTIFNNQITAKLNAVKTDVGGVRCKFVKNHVFIAGSVVTYFTQDGDQATANTYEGSSGEYCIRTERDTLHRIPTGIVIANNVVINHNGKKKQAAGFREGQVTVTGNTWSGPIRFGEESPAGMPPITDAKSCNPASICSGNTFTAPDGAPAIQVYGGSTLAVTGNTFDLTCLQGAPISVGAGSVVTVAGNTQHALAGHFVPKLVGISSHGVYTPLEKADTKIVIVAN